MKYKNIFYNIIFLLILTSCDKGIKVSIDNKSDFKLENVEVSTSEQISKVKFDKINRNEKVQGFLNMKNNKSDGGYVLKLNRNNGKKEFIGVGYYTNGAPLDCCINFVIENDTIITDIKHNTLIDFIF